MLDFMRKKSNSSLVLVIFGIIILSFILAGNFGGRGNGGGAKVADVNGIKISAQELQTAVSRETEKYKQQLGENFTPELMEKLNIRKQSLEMLVEKVLINDYADKNDIEVTDADVRNYIVAQTYFQDGGVFTKEKYLQVLKDNNLTSGSFEKGLRESLLAQKATETITGAVKVSDDEIRNLYISDKSKFKFDYSQTTIDNYLSKASVTEEEVRTYLNDNASLYMVPRKVKAFYAYTNKFDIRNTIKISDEEARAYFETNQAEFSSAEEVKVRHILIKPSDMKDESAKASARTKLEGILQEIRTGADFAAKAKEYTDDPGSRDNGGFYDYFKRGMMVKPFEDAAFALEKGKVSDIVETQYGFHIIKNEGYRGGSAGTYESVSAEVKTRLKAQLVEKTSYDAIAAIEGSFRGAQSTDELKSVATKDGISTRETSFVGDNDASEEVTRVKALNDALFSLQAGETSQIIDTPAGTYLLRLAENQDTHRADYGDVKDEISKIIKETKAMDLAISATDSLIENVKSGLAGSFKNFAKSKGFKTATTDYLKESDGELKDLGVQLSGNRAIFGLTKENPVSASAIIGKKGAFVFYFKEKVEPSMEDYETSKAEYEGRLRQEKSSKAYTSWIESLRGNAVIKYYEG